MVNRWECRPEPKPGQGQLYWHILFGDEPQLQALATIAQERLASFPGLHLTPKKWLHLTIMLVGFAEDFTAAEIKDMRVRARHLLSGMPPVNVTFSKVLYHPEAIVLGLKPTGALDPVFKAVRDATYSATGRSETTDDGSWNPHVTLAYSTVAQSASPIVHALGRELPRREVTVTHVSLIVQKGPERLWDWSPVEEIPLGHT
jgi:2'-5' RNA ligase